MLKDKDIHSLGLKFDDSRLEPLHRLYRSESSGTQEQKAKLPTLEESHGMENLLREQKKTQGPNLKDDNDPNYISYNRYVDKHLKRSSEEETEYDDGRLEIISNSSTPKQPMDYDYDSLRSDYYHEVLETLHNATSFNYTTKNKTEETTGDAIEEILQLPKPEDTNKKGTGNIAIKFIKWIFGFKRSNTRMQNAMQVLKIIVFLAFVFLLMSIVCWCKFGLCCCCFRCSFCWPRRLINKAKKYMALNPPGVLIEGGKEKRHEPTIYEIEAYNKLRSAIMNL
ncbi:hypothetical protein B7P43_G04805 [Cryptotermes secundus]|uniref:Uncharacterized protein n=1 Tax=Cryptotermes secundus TaxID=105785 RepID=A0A2J7R399_9NEOP|nr:hypothetical protein B7P43_G04805 [Cryptotermes secundus]